MHQDATVAYAATPQHARPKQRELLVEYYWTRGHDLNAELGALNRRRTFIEPGRLLSAEWIPPCGRTSSAR